MKEFKSFCKTVGGSEGTLCHYNTRLDTYGCGCQHDCSYCYAKSLLEFRGLWYSGEPATADIEKIRNKIKKIKGEVGIVRLGGMTDCFQPIERLQRVTYQTIKALNDAGIEYLIVTKSDLIADGAYMDVMDKDLAHIQVSVTATDNLTAAKYEKASPISNRIWAIEVLERAGFDVSIRLSPFIPEFVDLDVINNIECQKILVEFLRVNTFIKRTFDNISYEPYTLRVGNYWHRPLENKLELLEGITIPQKSVCDDVPEHWEYFKEHVNFNRDDCCNLRKA